MSSVPRDFHFIHGLREPHEPLHLVHYLCLESCRRVNRPATLHLHCPQAPTGTWWERIAAHVTLHVLGHESFVHGSAHYERSPAGAQVRAERREYAHETDFLRLKVLLKLGGVYADLDTLFVRPIPGRLFEHPFVLGELPPVPGPNGILQPALGHALILCAPAAAFARRWLERMYWTFDGSAQRHTRVETGSVWREMPDAVHVVPQDAFYRYTDADDDLAILLREGEVDRDLADATSLHLWAQRWWDARPGAAALPHAGLLTERYVRDIDTTYNVAARRFLDPE